VQIDAPGARSETAVFERSLGGSARKAPRRHP
jgi:hypothetical protein